ncbi:hypothetical protein KY385_02065 [Candidatus Parcubacteria bacterium]|nr:hypothetical protein [Candidatus Parcubacteria bacterium]
MADDNTNDNTSDDLNNDDQFLVNNPDDTNPMDDIKKDEQLPEDHATPFSPPSGVQDRIDDTHQVTDDINAEHEHYDAGIEAESGVDLPGEAADEAQDPPV